MQQVGWGFGLSTIGYKHAWRRGRSSTSFALSNGNFLAQKEVEDLGGTDQLARYARQVSAPTSSTLADSLRKAFKGLPMQHRFRALRRGSCCQP